MSSKDGKIPGVALFIHTEIQAATGSRLSANPDGVLSLPSLPTLRNDWVLPSPGLRSAANPFAQSQRRHSPTPRPPANRERKPYESQAIRCLYCYLQERPRTYPHAASLASRCAVPIFAARRSGIRRALPHLAVCDSRSVRFRHRRSCSHCPRRRHHHRAEGMFSFRRRQHHRHEHLWLSCRAVDVCLGAVWSRPVSIFAMRHFQTAAKPTNALRRRDH
jgi:hypothetical protein